MFHHSDCSQKYPECPGYHWWSPWYPWSWYPLRLRSTALITLSPTTLSWTVSPMTAVWFLTAPSTWIPSPSSLTTTIPRAFQGGVCYLDCSCTCKQSLSVLKKTLFFSLEVNWRDSDISLLKSRYWFVKLKYIETHGQIWAAVSFRSFLLNSNDNGILPATILEIIAGGVSQKQDSTKNMRDM